MATDRQIAANRANAAKSTGATSPEGKEISSRNSLRHGMLASTVVLDIESRDRFMLLLSEFHDQFTPRNPAESALVETMVVARWRQLRLWGLEKSSLCHEIRKQETDPNNQDALEQDASTRAALAFRRLSDDSRTLELMNRYEGRYDRQYTRALNKLTEFREKSVFSKRTQFSETPDTTDVDI